MNSIRYILIIILISLVCSAKTCTEDKDTLAINEENSVMNLRESVKNLFVSDTLSDQLIRAFEISAAEKLNDFADYMKIISDTTLDFRFRQHAAELVRNLFVSDEIGLSEWSETLPESGLNTLEHLLEHSLSEGISCWIQPVNIKIKKPFMVINDSTVTGTLSFIRYSNPLNGSGHFEVVPGEVTINIFIIKKIKAFGDYQLRVWDVYLGSAE